MQRLESTGSLAFNPNSAALSQASGGRGAQGEKAWKGQVINRWKAVGLCGKISNKGEEKQGVTCKN